jgi:diacylglycerol kinase family enzyme
VAAGHTTQVDVGELNGDIFINNSSLGLYPRIVEYREEQEKMGRHRLLAFGAACLVALRRYPFLDIRLRCEGKDLRLRTPFLFIGNNVYEMEGLRLGHRRRLVAGTLSLYVAHRTGRLGLLRLAMSALVGRLRLNHDMDVFESREVVIDTRRKRIHVALDGEVIRISPPLVYKVLPKALTVVVPPGR